MWFMYIRDSCRGTSQDRLFLDQAWEFQSKLPREPVGLS